jgi:hypothetical protein
MLLILFHYTAIVGPKGQGLPTYKFILEFIESEVLDG